MTLQNTETKTLKKFVSTIEGVVKNQKGQELRKKFQKHGELKIKEEQAFTARFSEH